MTDSSLVIVNDRNAELPGSICRSMIGGANERAKAWCANRTSAKTPTIEKEIRLILKVRGQRIRHIMAVDPGWSGADDGQFINHSGAIRW